MALETLKGVKKIEGNPVPDIGKGDIVRLKQHGEIGEINRAEFPEQSTMIVYKVWRVNTFHDECVDLMSKGYLALSRIHKSRLVLVNKAEGEMVRERDNV